jgi:hypothetical protein
MVLFALASPLASPRPALAQDRDARAAAEALFAAAEEADEARSFALALTRYEEARALDPGSPHAPRAEARAALLRAHSEGAFGPLSELERIRRDPALASDPRAIDELVAHADRFPPGPVRIEVWVMAAEAYERRLARPAEAGALLRRVLADPLTDPVLARKAARDLVTARLAAHDLRGAEAVLRLAGPGADPALGRDIRRLRRRTWLHYTSTFALGAVAILAAARRGEASRAFGALARTWKVAIGYAVYVAAGGALLASGYEQGTARPFLWYGAALVPIFFVARLWGAAGGTSRVARAGRAFLCGASAAGAALLVLEGVDPTFLDGMGL